ncbi:hypothetical protein VSDG_03177 [Cytospora chrysosperma]|uniref:N-acetyltransferase domain-containing protein n=1 Tax=Cytospora chrysosperma TaxID=252740 RepID=A0A423WBA3_CYTCH|nr:hypothetical protein VSDG_03177 [Valsa sordida]
MSAQHKDSRQITYGGKEYVDRANQVLTRSFLGDPVYTWLLHDFSLSEQETVLPKLLSAFLTQGALNGAIFIEVADFGCCGVLMPPGKSIENPWTLPSAGLLSTLWTIGLGGFKRAMFEYSSGAEPLMKKAFTKAEQHEHWYVFIMGTAVDKRRQGHASTMLTHMQNRARDDGRPIWLEATTDYSRKLYLKHGFTLVGDVVLGKGKVGQDGLPKKDGEGITIWSMFWRP